MIQSAERVGAPSSIKRVVVLGRLKATLLRDEVLVGSPHLTAIGLITLSLALQTTIVFNPGHFRPAPTWYCALLVSAGTFASLGLCLVASMPVKRFLPMRLRQAVCGAGLGVLAVLAVVGFLRGTTGVYQVAHRTPYNNDGAVMDVYAATRVLHGHDPYLKTNIVTALAGINAPATTTTPLMDGQFRGTTAYPSDQAVQQVFLNVLRYRPRTIPAEFESKYNYPAGSFLFILPFVWAGLYDMRFLYALAVMGMAVYLWMRMPGSLRLLVPFLVLANVPVIASATGGQPDPLYGLFLMLGYAEWRRHWLSPLAMGVALATKQLAWFFIPFYVLLAFRHFGWREVVRRCGLMSVTFLMINGPFILESPRSYISSVTAPLQDPMFPLGIGVIALFVGSVLPMLPKVAFTLAEIASWVGGSLAFARTRFLTAASGVALAGFPLFFAWRSLTTYFYLIPLLVLAVVLADNAESRSDVRELHASEP